MAEQKNASERRTLWIVLGLNIGLAIAFFASGVFGANLGIVVAGGLVAWLGTNWSDLVVGVIVAGIAAWGGVEILKDAHGEHHKSVHDDEQSGEDSA